MEERTWTCRACGAVNIDFGPEHVEQPTVEVACEKCDSEWLWSETPEFGAQRQASQAF